MRESYPERNRDDLGLARVFNLHPDALPGRLIYAFVRIDRDVIRDRYPVGRSAGKEFLNVAKAHIPLAWTWQIQWSNPYTAPPDGQPRVRMSVTRATPHAHPAPPVIDRAIAIIGFGRGWCVSCGPTMPPSRKLSPEAKGKIRRRNLERRVQKAAPLFANDLFQIELAKQPDYYQGEDK